MKKLGKRDFLHRIKKRSRGVAMIETAVVFPLFILLIFLVLEFQQLGQVRGAVSALAGMMAQDFSVSGSARSFPGCIKKFSHILNPAKISYYIHLYEDLDDITPHEAYFDTNGNGKFDANEPYADMNLSKSFDFVPHEDTVFVGRNDQNKNFFAENPKLKTGLVVVLYKFSFVLGLIQQAFSYVSMINDKNALPIIGTGLIIRRSAK